jgi:hypothetical protein
MITRSATRNCSPLEILRYWFIDLRLFFS